MITLEVRGRGKSWRVLYPDEGRYGSPVQVFDREGNYRETLLCGCDPQGMTEAHFEGTEEDARAFAAWLSPGCEVKVIRTMSRGEALARARRAKQLA